MRKREFGKFHKKSRNLVGACSILQLRGKKGGFMKKVFLAGLGVCLFISYLCNVHAENISYKRLDNIYYNLTVDGKFESNHVTMFYLADRLAYCIEPGKEITTKVYDSYKDWSKVDFSDDTKAYIERLGYYGYEYPGHQTDKYYIATQELIWKAAGNVNIKWTTGENNGGSIINVEKEKSEILRLIEEDKKKPSFINDIITGEVSEKLILEDKNGVISNYDVGLSKYHNISIDDDKLIITFNDEEKPMEEVTLSKKHYDNKTLLVYVKDNSQKLASLRLSNQDELSLRVQNKETPTEVVRVPNTLEDDIVKRFDVVIGFNYNASRFN